jgi:hypothetical protein
VVSRYVWSRYLKRLDDVLMCLVLESSTRDDLFQLLR